MSKSKETEFEEVKDNRLIEHHIETLIISCRIAQQKGVYTLEEARTIMNAIDFLNSDKEK